MNPQTHHKSVSLDDLVIDSTVQRQEGIDQRKVAKIVAAFDPLALGTITVSQRPDGTLILLDGAHRCAGARKAGHNAFLSAEVITGLSHQDEARLFLLLNETTTPTPITKFLVRIVKGDPVAVAINNTLGEHGWAVRTFNAPGVLTAVAAAERVYRNGGGSISEGEHPDLFAAVVSIVTGAWEHDQSAVNGHILLAVAQLIGRFGPSVDTKKLVAEMQGTRPGVLLGRAKVLRDAQGGTVPAALARILAGMHNNRRRSNLLPEWVWIR